MSLWTTSPLYQMAVYHPKMVTISSGGSLVAEVIYPHPCLVHHIHVAHTSGTATWVQVHDANSAPADGAVPKMVHTVAANQDAKIEPHGPVRFENGVYVCESSTLPTKTLSVTPHLFVFIMIEELSYTA